jgi:hypothetical protein
MSAVRGGRANGACQSGAVRTGSGTTVVKTSTVPSTSRFTIAVNGPASHVRVHHFAS